MKNLSLALNVILILAVGFLYFQHYGSHSTEAKSESRTKPTGDTLAMQNPRLAWIHSDSLVENYNYHRELRNELESKFKMLEEDIARRTDALKENYSILEQQAPNLSKQKLQMAQRELMQKEQELRQYQQQRAQELSQREQELTLMIKEDMDTIFNNMKKEYNLDFILSYDPNSILLSANEEYNITEEVVERLNERHRQNKEQKKNAEGDS